MDAIMQVGVGGIFAILVLKTVLPYMKRKNGGGGEMRRADDVTLYSMQLDLRKQGILMGDMHKTMQEVSLTQKNQTAILAELKNISDRQVTASSHVAIALEELRAEVKEETP